jgi:hypothetical protein
MSAFDYVALLGFASFPAGAKVVLPLSSPGPHGCLSGFAYAADDEVKAAATAFERGALDRHGDYRGGTPGSAILGGGCPTFDASRAVAISRRRALDRSPWSAGGMARAAGPPAARAPIDAARTWLAAIDLDHRAARSRLRGRHALDLGSQETCQGACGAAG